MESLKKHFPDDLDRRQFLKHSTAATLAALTGNVPRLLGSEAGKKIEPRADTLILLWMAGATCSRSPPPFRPQPRTGTRVDGARRAATTTRQARVVDRSRPPAERARRVDFSALLGLFDQGLVGGE